METGGSGGGGGGDDVHGLKFGKKIYFEQDAAGGSGTAGAGGRKGKGAAGGGAASSAAVAATQPPRCQVAGCGVDLSGAKAYYCRHKVCSMHSKAPRVVVAGIEQRFCQQCSRYSLDAYSSNPGPNWVPRIGSLVPPITLFGFLPSSAGCCFGLLFHLWYLGS